MKNIIKRALFVAPVILAATLTTTQASAHPGHHMESSISAVIQHLMSSPYHLGLAIGIAFSVASALVVWKVWAKKQSGTTTNIN